MAGVALGWIVGRLINFGANIYIQNQGGTPGNLFSLPIWLIGGAIGFSISDQPDSRQLSRREGGTARSDSGRFDTIEMLEIKQEEGSD